MREGTWTGVRLRSRLSPELPAQLSSTWTSTWPLPHICPNSEALIRCHLQECAAPCATGTLKNGLYLNEDDFWSWLQNWFRCRCDMGVDSNGCWMGNWCQDMALGEPLQTQLHLSSTSVKPNSRWLPWCHHGQQEGLHGEEEGYGSPRWKHQSELGNSWFNQNKASIRIKQHLIQSEEISPNLN